MNGKGFRSLMARRLFLAGLGAGAGVVGASVVSSPAAAAEGAADTPWRPARHAQDDWYDKVPGVHRYLIDSSSGEAMGWALQFASNYYAANQDAYGLKDSDLAVIIVARHKSTSFAYNDAIWAKYGKTITEQSDFMDPKTKEAPKINVYGPAGETQQAGKMDAADQERRAVRRVLDVHSGHLDKNRQGQRFGGRRRFQGNYFKPHRERAHGSGGNPGRESRAGTRLLVPLRDLKLE